MSKGLEALKVLIMSSTTIFNTKEQIDESIKNIEKELKTLEIIKKLHIFDDINWEDYEKLDDDAKNIITQEEYDLLKEVLL